MKPEFTPIDWKQIDWSIAGPWLAILAALGAFWWGVLHLARVL
jgi:hypothetical protein